MPRKFFPLSHPDMQGFYAKLRRGETSERIERDDRYRALAFSNHAAVAVMLCRNWLRDPGTGARGRDLADLQLVHMYDKVVDGGEYRQGFWVIMWSLRATDPSVDSVRHATMKHDLMFKHCALGFDRTEQQDKLAWLYEKAHQFETEGAFLRPRVFAIGVPVESEKYGKGSILEAWEKKQARLKKRLEITVTQGKGGISEPRTNLGSITLPDSNG